MKFSTLVHTDKSIIVTDFFHIQPRLKGFLDFTHLALIKKTHTQLDMPSDLWKRASLINYMGTVYYLDLPLSFIIPYPQSTYPRSGAILQRRWQRGFASSSPNITKTKQPKLYQTFLFALFGSALNSRAINHPLPWELVLLDPFSLLPALSL